MYSFRLRAQITAEEQEKYLNKQTTEEMLNEYLAVSEDFAKDNGPEEPLKASAEIPF